jgi:hypothetical protein
MQPKTKANDKSYATLLVNGCNEQFKTRSNISPAKKTDSDNKIKRLIKIKKIKDLLTKSLHISHLLKVEIMHKIERNISVEIMMHEDPAIYLRQAIEEYANKSNKSWAQRVGNQKKMLELTI